MVRVVCTDSAIYAYLSCKLTSEELFELCEFTCIATKVIRSLVRRNLKWAGKEEHENVEVMQPHATTLSRYRLDAKSSTTNPKYLLYLITVTYFYFPQTTKSF